MADVLAPIDEALRKACVKRDRAWRRAVIKDNAQHRAQYAEACTELDALLERRHATRQGSQA